MKHAFLVIFPVCLLSCNSISNDMHECGVYLEFIYDRNMDYTDSFDTQVETVDVFIFDDQNRYLFTEQSRREELIDGKKMLLCGDMSSGNYKILTVGGLSNSFRISDLNGNPLTPGQTLFNDVEISLIRQSRTVSYEFPPLWVGTGIDVEYKNDISTWQVYLMKYTNNFHLQLTETDKKNNIRASEALYSFEIVTPEGAVYGKNHSPLLNEKVTYLPYELEAGEEPDVLSKGEINTMRLLDRNKLDYKIIIRNIETRQVMWEYDLMTLLKHTKPKSRPDGSNLPMQEYLDRQSEWKVVVFYEEEGTGFVAVGVEINDWILWLNEIGV